MAEQRAPGRPALPARSSQRSRTQALGALDLVVDARSTASLGGARSTRTSSSPRSWSHDDDRIDGRYLEVHQGILSLLALQAPVASDLRLVAALLHVIKHVERMGDQCVNIAKMLPLVGLRAAGRRPSCSRRSCAWAALARSEVAQCQAGVPAARRRRWPRTSCARTREINRLNREVFRARGGDRRRTPTARVGDDHDARRAGASSGSATTPSTSASRSRSSSRGLFREFSDASHVPGST